jgi:hypothetical protein
MEAALFLAAQSRPSLEPAEWSLVGVGWKGVRPWRRLAVGSGRDRASAGMSPAQGRLAEGAAGGGSGWPGRGAGQGGAGRAGADWCGVA